MAREYCCCFPATTASPAVRPAAAAFAQRLRLGCLTSAKSDGRGAGGETCIVRRSKTRMVVWSPEFSRPGLRLEVGPKFSRPGRVYLRLDDHQKSSRL